MMTSLVVLIEHWFVTDGRTAWHRGTARTELALRRAVKDQYVHYALKTKKYCISTELFLVKRYRPTKKAKQPSFTRYQRMKKTNTTLQHVKLCSIGIYTVQIFPKVCCTCYIRPRIALAIAEDCYILLGAIFFKIFPPTYFSTSLSQFSRYFATRRGIFWNWLCPM